MSETKLDYLERKPEKQNISMPKSIFLLHGYGSNMHDLFGFAHQLPEGSHIFSFNAPLNTMFGGSAWYNLNYDSEGLRFDLNEIINSKELIANNIINLIKEKELNPNDVTIIGFSQGAIMSYLLAADYPELISRILAFSGYLLDNYKTQDKMTNLNKADIFISHGIYDEVIPVEMARSTKKAFEEKKVDVFYKEYVMEHGISPECLTDALEWLNNSMSDSRR
jgi:phospholipase/carboxylesterase